MPSLENRVAQQRDALMAHGADIQRYAQRTHTRLGHPVVLIPAFLGGMLAARGVPVLLRAMPEITTRVRHLITELSTLGAMVRLLDTLAHRLGSNTELPATDCCRQGGTTHSGLTGD